MRIRISSVRTCFIKRRMPSCTYTALAGCNPSSRSQRKRHALTLDRDWLGGKGCLQVRALADHSQALGLHSTRFPMYTRYHPS